MCEALSFFTNDIVQNKKKQIFFYEWIKPVVSKGNNLNRILYFVRAMEFHLKKYQSFYYVHNSLHSNTLYNNL